MRYIEKLIHNPLMVKSLRKNVKFILQLYILNINGENPKKEMIIGELSKNIFQIYNQLLKNSIFPTGISSRWNSQRKRLKNY